MRRTVRAAVAAVFPALTLTSCSSGAAPGTVVDGTETATGPAATFRLPAGSVEVTVGDGRERVPEELAGDGESHNAPGGGQFVPVTWEYTRAAAPALGAASITPLLSVESGDDSFQVAEIDTAQVRSFTAWVGVEDDEQVTVAVEFDGASQTYDPATDELDTGPAEPLYATDAPAPTEVDCPRHGWSNSTRIGAEPFCELTWTTLPWGGPDRGWAEPGRSWLVLTQARVGTGRMVVGDLQGPDYVWYEADHLRLELLADGSEPVETDFDAGEARHSRAPTVSGSAVFDVPRKGRHVLEVGMRADLSPAARAGALPHPSQPTIRLSRSIELGR